LFSLTSENTRGFSVWCELAKLRANSRNYSHTRMLATSAKTMTATIQTIK
jgi:hypothetical protein